VATPTTNASITTAPAGTGTTITPTLPTHAAGDVIGIFIVNSGITAWSAPAGWTTKQQQASSGNASTGLIGTLLYRRVLSGDSLPLASPVCNLGATVTRSAVSLTKRGADLEGVHILPEWLAFASTAGTANPVRPPGVVTRSPDNLVHIYYGSRAATTAPEQTSYTQVQQVINSGIIVNNVSERNIADQATTLANQDASPTSGVRWIAMISCTPSPDYPYYRAGSQALNASGLSATPALPAGTSASDNRGNKDLIIATVEAVGIPTLSPNTPADWIALPDWSNTTSGGGTTVRKYAALYDGSLDRQFNRSTTGEIFVYFSTYHNAHQSTPTGTSAVQQNASSTTSTFPALPRTGTKATVQATCVADATPTFTAPTNWIERNDSQGVTCADQSFNAIGSTASASFTLSSASPTLAGLMEVFSVASAVVLTLTPMNATLTATGFAVKLASAATPASTSLAVMAFAPVVSVLAGETNVTPATASLIITTPTPWLRTLITPVPASLVVVAFAPSLRLMITPASQSLTSSALTPSLREVVTPASANLLLAAFVARAVQFAEFPQTLVLDSFNRADTGPPPAANWATGLGFQAGAFNTGHRIVSNVLRRQSGSLPEAESRWSLAEYGPDCECFITVTSGGVAVLALGVRVHDIGDGTASGYFAHVSHLDTYNLYRVDSGAITLLAENISLPTISTGNRYGIQAIGATIRFWADTGSGWEEIISAEDSTYSAAGIIGIYTESSAIASMDDFGGGTLREVLAIVAPQSLTLTSLAPAVTVAINVTPTPAALVVTRFTLALKTITTPPATTLALSALAPSVTLGVTIVPTTASLTLIALAVILTERATLTTATLALSTSTPSVTVSADVIVTPAAQALTLARFALRLHERLTANVTALSLVAFAPSITISADIAATPAVRSLVLATFGPTLHERLIPTVTSLSISTFAPALTISADKTVAPEAQVLALQAFAPVLRETAVPATTTLTISAHAPSLRLTVQPATGTHTLSASAPTVTTGAVTGTIITPATATLTLSGYAPWLFLGLVPASRTFIVESGQYEIEIDAGQYEFVDDYEDSEVLVS
jgi:hypothetical protein